MSGTTKMAAAVLIAAMATPAIGQTTTASRVKELERRLNGLIEANQAFLPTIEGMTERVDRLEREMQEAQKASRNASLAADMTGLEARLGQIESQWSSVRGQLSEQQWQLAALTNQIQALRSANENANAQWQQQQRYSQSNSERLRVDRLESQILRLQAIIEAQQWQAKQSEPECQSRTRDSFPSTCRESTQTTSRGMTRLRTVSHSGMSQAVPAQSATYRTTVPYGSWKSATTTSGYSWPDTTASRYRMAAMSRVGPVQRGLGGRVSGNCTCRSGGIPAGEPGAFDNDEYAGDGMVVVTVYGD